LQQVDATMQDIAQLHLSIHRDPPYWSFLDESLKEVYGHEGNAVLIRVTSPDQRVLHQSTEWPHDYDASLPAPGAMREPFATGPGPGPGSGLFRGRPGRGRGPGPEGPPRFPRGEGDFP